MSFGDLDRAIDSLIKLAIFPLILLVIFSLFTSLLAQLPPGAVFGLLCMLGVMSPVAYVIREKLSGRPRRQGAPRGAERTPIVPTFEEDE